MLGARNYQETDTFPEFGQASPPTIGQKVTQVAAGSDHCLALLEDGTVIAWGAGTQSDMDREANAGANRDDRHEGQSIVPSVLQNPSTAKVVYIATGPRAVLQFKMMATVFAWGRSNYDATSPPDGVTNIKEISMTRTHVVALLKNGKVVSWGEIIFQENLFLMI